MRLGQLARKLAVRPSVIVDFLASNHLQIEDGSNTRLEEGHVLLIMQKFAPESSIEEIAAVSQEKDEVPAPLTHEIILKETDSATEEAAQVESPLIALDETPDAVLPEVIKAPKIELSGLKVLGKIELPEPKKKEEISKDISVDTPADLKLTESKRRTEEPKKAYVRRDTRSQKNPVSVAREKEADEARRKREAEEELSREQRTKNYFKKVKVAPPTRRMKLVDEGDEELTVREMQDPPKTILGKFFRWLKT